MVAVKPPIRRVRPTLLAVGEGECEEAFLKHLRALYCSAHAGVHVAVCHAHGKGPENVVEHALGCARNRQYDRKLALLDRDIPWHPTLVIKKSRIAKLQLIGSTPSLEGLLLKILGKAIPHTSGACKESIASLLNADLTETTSYATPFPKTLLEAARPRIPELDDLLTLFQGQPVRRR